MLKKISLTDFRNFTKKEFEFGPQITVIVGKNASGKTNILESIYLASTAKSFKATLESEMIKESTDIARVEAEIENEKKIKLEAVLTRGEVALVDGNRLRANKKKLMVNGIPKRQVDFRGIFKTVLFAPSDMEIITDSPSIRRRFLDEAISQVDREYYVNLLSFEKGIRQRNKILISIRENGIPRSSLLFWDQLVIKTGNIISDKRREFVEFINNTEQLPEINLKVSYDESAISEGRLKQYEREEVMAGTTLVGPHRDDINLSIFNPDRIGVNLQFSKSLHIYGSRGEQRMGVLWLKLAQLKFIESVSGEKPTLLLDDIFSELDHRHRQIVFDVIKNYQTILTTADPHYVEGLPSDSEGLEGGIIKI